MADTFWIVRHFADKTMRMGCSLQTNTYHFMHRISAYLLAALCLTFASCINEDLSDCGVNYGLEYQVMLTTNVQTEITTELTSEAEVEVGEKLLQALSGFFAKYANDVNLNFYTLDPPQELRHNEYHYIGGSSASYTIYLPAEDYRHLSVANVSGEATVNMQANSHASLFNMVQEAGDTVPSHSYGLFSARRNMQVLGDKDQVFHVSLYMQNCAAALVVDQKGVAHQDMQVFLQDLATGFTVNDSTYIYKDSPVVRTHRLETDGQLLCNYGMSFPSPASPAEVEPSGRDVTETTLWRIKAYVTMPDGSITETTLSIPTPLKAGQLRIIKAYMLPNGGLTPVDAEVGASVELDWKQGGTYEPEL